jgi:chloramphenicol-sensitive protein RarD
MNKYYLSAVSAYVMWGFFSLALKSLSEYSSFDILFYRIVAAAFLMVVVTLLFRKSVLEKNASLFRSLQRKERIRLTANMVAGGLLLTGNWFFFIYSMIHISVKSASYAYLVCPILTAFFAWLLIGEKLSRLQWLAVGISAVSCMILAWDAVRDLFSSLFIAASYALYLVLQRKNNSFDRFFLLTFQMIVSLAVLAVLFPLMGGQLPGEVYFYEMMIVIAVAFTIVPLFLNLYSLNGLSAATVGILMYINPLVNFAFAIFYFREGITFTQAVAYSLVFISIFIYNQREIRGLLTVKN